MQDVLEKKTKAEEFLKGITLKDLIDKALNKNDGDRAASILILGIMSTTTKNWTEAEMKQLINELGNYTSNRPKVIFLLLREMLDMLKST